MEAAEERACTVKEEGSRKRASARPRPGAGLCLLSSSGQWPEAPELGQRDREFTKHLRPDHQDLEDRGRTLSFIPSDVEGPRAKESDQGNNVSLFL